MVKPRVLILSHMYPASCDKTAGIFIHHHVQALIKMGVELQVVSPVPWSPRFLWFRDKWRYYGYFPRKEIVDQSFVLRPRYFEAPYKCFRPLSGWSMFKCLLPYLRKLQKNFQFNIIHAHTITPDGYAATFLKKHFNVPLISSIRGSDLNEYPFYSKRMYRVSKIALEKSNAVVAVSNDLAKKAMSMAPIKEFPSVIYNGVDTNRFYNYYNKKYLKESEGISRDTKVISFIGRCEREKGIFELLEAFIRIIKSGENVCLLIIGNGKETIQKIVNEQKVENKVILKGKVLHDDIPKYLNASDIFVLPTYAEGMANAIYEAMACELPVVATKVGGIPEVIEDEYDGLLCPPRDVFSLENCIVKLLKDPEYSQMLGQRAAMKIKDKYSWAKNAQEHFKIYEKILGKKNEG